MVLATLHLWRWKINDSKNHSDIHIFVTLFRGFLLPSEMENMKFFLTFAFIVDHCFAVCTFEVRWPDFDIDLFLCVNFLFLKGNQTIDQFSGAEGETCANWQVCNGVHPLCLCPGQVSQLARGSGSPTRGT